MVAFFRHGSFAGGTGVAKGVAARTTGVLGFGESERGTATGAVRLIHGLDFATRLFGSEW